MATTSGSGNPLYEIQEELYVTESFWAATQPQLDFIESLRKQLHLSDALLDNHTQRQFGYCVGDLSKQDASTLIEEMKGWTDTAKALPPVLQREAGQADLPGFGS